MDKKQFILANQDKVKELEIEVDEILQFLDCEEALVTDESVVADFMDYYFTDMSDAGAATHETLEELSGLLGVDIQDEYETVVSIAQRIKDNK